jgi:hypothetical protein
MSARRYLNSRCMLCANSPVFYVKTKGGFYKVCDLCASVLEGAGLLIEPDKIFAMDKSRDEISEVKP